VQIFQGDCRQVASENNLVGIADRVSLGLLPSSEGGWRTAIKALKDDTGGWLHIHGNVPGKEKDAWVMWVCRQLYNMTKEEKKEHDNWQVLCNHVEKVKSFAPTVFHYVADVFVGPGTAGSVVVVVQGDGTFLHCPEDIQPPSCALSEDGVLHQKWMR
jgi:tRNA G37 N-methylase Trm5